MGLILSGITERGFAVYDKMGNFWSCYTYGKGPHRYIIRIKNDKDFRQRINYYTGMIDKFWRV